MTKRELIDKIEAARAWGYFMARSRKLEDLGEFIRIIDEIKQEVLRMEYVRRTGGT